MGFPVVGYGDTVVLERRDDLEIVIKDINGAEGIPLDRKLNVASVAIDALLKKAKLEAGFDISITKNIAPGSGLGSSASSSVAAVFGANDY